MLKQMYQPIMDAIDNGIKKSLNEELSISTNVNQHTLLLKKQILQDSYKQCSNHQGDLTYKSGVFVCNLFGTDYTIKYTIYTCDIQICKQYLNSYAIVRTSTLVLNLLEDNGKPYQKYFDGAIEHELLHLYQYNNSKKDLLSDKKVKKLYDMVKDIFDNSDDDKLLTLANAVYASFDFEQDAMVHALYAQLMQIPVGINYKYVLNKSDEYEYIYDMKYILDNKEDIDLTRYNVSSKYVFAIIKKGLKRFYSKVGKMISKYLKDYELPIGCTIPQIIRH